MNFRSISDLSADLFRWSDELPRDLTLIVGIPRSGILAASILALHRNLPFQVNGGFERRWRADGKELYYLYNYGNGENPDGKLMAVTIKWSTIPEPGVPQELFPIAGAGFGADGANQYVAAADGQRFLFIRNVAALANVAGTESITVLVNWTAALNNK
jgi:hypothetical protein